MTGFPAALAYFALAWFWVNTLLVVAAGWQEYARLSAALGAARRGRVLEGAGPEGQLAEHRVVQVGRSKGDGKIYFHDRAREDAVYGGAVALLGEAAPQAIAPGAGAVWAGRAQLEQAAACAGEPAFAEAYARATKASGWSRTVRAALVPGDPVWLATTPAGPLLAGCDPQAWRRGAAARTAGLVLGVSALAAGCTALCLWPPVFGTVSKLGAFAALVAFNLIQLFGKLHHDAIQPPGALALRGVWRRPG